MLWYYRRGLSDWEHLLRDTKRYDMIMSLWSGGSRCIFSFFFSNFLLVPSQLKPFCAVFSNKWSFMFFFRDDWRYVMCLVTSTAEKMRWVNQKWKPSPTFWPRTNTSYVPTSPFTPTAGTSSTLGATKSRHIHQTLKIWLEL